MRFVKTSVPSFAELGLKETIKKIAEAPRGIILVAGSTGSGKSTTLAAMIEHVNANFKKHIVTMEDPIEFVFEDNQSVIEQREVGLDTLSFQHALKHVLRQDPDIIMVGEMRDATSFTAAMSAADTGHLVLSTLQHHELGAIDQSYPGFLQGGRARAGAPSTRGHDAGGHLQRMVGTIAGGMTPAVEIMINTPTVRKLIEENRLDKCLPPSRPARRRHDQFQPGAVRIGEGRESFTKRSLGQATNPQALEMNFKRHFLGRRSTDSWLGKAPSSNFHRRIIQVWSSTFRLSHDQQAKARTPYPEPIGA